ncbi:hypothetical protein P12x_005394 [Tundrisphaera lichenicola]|uniref:hypothetical protein n=1 Tax=Tundrisphaera lichenicola TaxID=2029860 RepID=UPI003EC018B0
MIAIGLTLLWISSDRWYTTAGFDFEEARAGRVLVRYDRVRWDARCFWAGSAEQFHEPGDHPLDWWDPGGTLLAPSITPMPRSLANRLGWWLIRDVAEDPYEPTRYSGAIASRWIGIPGWIPPACFAAWPLARRIGRGRSRRTATGVGPIVEGVPSR